MLVYHEFYTNHAGILGIWGRLVIANLRSIMLAYHEFDEDYTLTQNRVWWGAKSFSAPNYSQADWMKLSFESCFEWL